jgi:porin
MRQRRARLRALHRIFSLGGVLLTLFVAPAEVSGETLDQSGPSSATGNDEISEATQDAWSAGSDDAISGNPGFTEVSPGSGELGRRLQWPEEWGVRLGGVILSDINNVFFGGAKPGALATNNLVILGLGVDGEKAIGWKGGSFGVNFLQFNGQNTNGYAGSFPGYNSIAASPPFNRTELYEYWVTQELIEDTLKVRVGKTIPAVDFNNVTRVNKLKDDSQNVSSLSSLIYPSIFVNPTLLGVIGGYYDSTFGGTAYLALNKNVWLTSGVYDGNKARGIPSGLRSPHFNEYVFAIAETGGSWVVGPQNHPGQFGIGGWYQSGRLKESGIYGDLQQTGAAGVYLYGGQRIWADRGEDTADDKVKSVSVFYQYGVNNSKTMAVNQFVGVGATAFSIFDDRPSDSFGAGMGLSFMNHRLFYQRSELMFQTYYQAALVPKTLYLQPTITYIPTPSLNNEKFNPLWPGSSPTLPSAFTGTLRLTGIF